MGSSAGRQHEWFNWYPGRTVMPLLAECWCCGSPRVRYLKRGPLCSNCYHRWHRNGFTGPGPGPARPPAAENAQEYAHIITSLSARRAAEQLGVSSRTIVRWRTALQEAS